MRCTLSCSHDLRIAEYDTANTAEAIDTDLYHGVRIFHAYIEYARSSYFDRHGCWLWWEVVLSAPVLAIVHFPLVDLQRTGWCWMKRLQPGGVLLLFLFCQSPKRLRAKSARWGCSRLDFGIGGVTLTLLLLHSLQDGKYDLLVS